MAHDNSRRNDRNSDDVRGPIDGDARLGTSPDAKDSSLQGSITKPTDRDGDDKAKHPPRPDSFDADLNSVGG